MKRGLEVSWLAMMLTASSEKMLRSYTPKYDAFAAPPICEPLFLDKSIPTYSAPFSVSAAQWYQ